MASVKTLFMSLRAVFPKPLVIGENGASLIAYVLLLTLVLIVAVGAIKIFGLSVSGSLSNSGNDISNAAGHG